MSLTRKKFREIVFNYLYSEAQAPGQNEDDFINFAMKQLKVTYKNVRMAIEYAEPLIGSKDIIDSEIEMAAKSAYELKRISSVELSILRLASYELLCDPTVPESVVIAEAMRLCIKFGSVGSQNFINAVLDCILKKKHADKE